MATIFRTTRVHRSRDRSLLTQQHMDHLNRWSLQPMELQVGVLLRTLEDGLRLVRVLYLHRLPWLLQPTKSLAFPVPTSGCNKWQISSRALIPSTMALQMDSVDPKALNQKIMAFTNTNLRCLPNHPFLSGTQIRWMFRITARKVSVHGVTSYPSGLGTASITIEEAVSVSLRSPGGKIEQPFSRFTRQPPHGNPNNAQESTNQQKFFSKSTMGYHLAHISSSTRAIHRLCF